MPTSTSASSVRRRLVPVLLLSALPVLVACGDAEDPAAGSTSTTQPSAGLPQSAPASTDPADPSEPADAHAQPPLPADPSGYTSEYVQATLGALYQDYQAAITAFVAAGAITDEVRAGLAQVYHPDVVDQQVRNLEDYFPGGENLEDPPGTVEVAVAEIHSASADCILAITTYDIDAVTTLEAPAEDDFFIGLAKNPADPDGTRPWLITVEYSTSDGEPLPEDVCA